MWPQELSCPWLRAGRPAACVLACAQCVPPRRAERMRACACLCLLPLRCRRLHWFAPNTSHSTARAHARLLLCVCCRTVQQAAAGRCFAGVEAARAGPCLLLTLHPSLQAFLVRRALPAVLGAPHPAAGTAEVPCGVGASASVCRGRPGGAPELVVCRLLCQGRVHIPCPCRVALSPPLVLKHAPCPQLLLGMPLAVPAACSVQRGPRFTPSFVLVRACAMLSSVGVGRRRGCAAHPSSRQRLIVISGRFRGCPAVSSRENEGGVAGGARILVECALWLAWMVVQVQKCSPGQAGPLCGAYASVLAACALAAVPQRERLL